MLFVPNRKKLFDDIDVSDECSSMSCNSLCSKPVNFNAEMVCMAGAHGECPRVNMAASELNQFIKDNDDVFMYLLPVGE